MIQLLKISFLMQHFNQKNSPLIQFNLKMIFVPVDNSECFQEKKPLKKYWLLNKKDWTQKRPLSFEVKIIL